MHRRTMFAVVVVLFFSALPLSKAHAAPRCFNETKQCLDGRIREYWEQNGGLPVFGYPVSSQAPEVNRDTGQSFQTQWMERNRFELHPENASPYDVLLGRLGDDRLRQLAIDWQTLPKADPSQPHYFAQTGHAIAHPPFWDYWRTHGLELGDRGVTERESLALFGLPISEPRIETNTSGDTVLTQWFERARFEDHGTKGVLLGLLGNEIRAGGNTTPPPAPAPARIVLEGNGQKVTDPFTLSAEYNRVTLEHTGQRNFIVWAYGPNDDRDLLVNTIGSYRGIRPLEGKVQYFFEIKADGAWKIIIEPMPQEATAAQGLDGTGDYTSGLFTPARTGRIPYKFSHEGERYFGVWLRCAGGDDLVANEIGRIQGETVVEFERGPCYWDIRGDGSWSVRPK